ncbi:hypothetical protein [Thiomonas sp.]|uniref:hypothetical protein n=1 Tax=Thiomonas sp. TaxID=2047785 RepID=UPI00261B257D|nr:hypothetical protein [Thiomonas sp.]
MMTDIATTLYQAIDLFEDAADALRKSILSHDQDRLPDTIAHIRSALAQLQRATEISQSVLGQLERQAPVR